MTEMQEPGVKTGAHDAKSNHDLGPRNNHSSSRSATACPMCKGSPRADWTVQQLENLHSAMTRQDMSGEEHRPAVVTWLHAYDAVKLAAPLPGSRATTLHGGLRWLLDADAT